jgi:hypothetical protein
MIMFNDEWWGELGFRVLRALGVMNAQEGQMQAAATWFGVQAGAYGDYVLLNERLSPIEHSEFEQALVNTRAELGEKSFSIAWESGRAKTVDQLIQMARNFLSAQQ